MVFEKVKEIIKEQLEIVDYEIMMESSLVDDLKANSVDVVGIIMALEDEYDIEFPFEGLEDMKTVGDAVEYIEKNK